LSSIEDRVRLERPTLSQQRPFLRAVRNSRDLHRGWVAPPSDEEQFARYVASLDARNREGFLVVTSGDDIAGVINVSEIVRGAFLSAYLGYYAFVPFAGRGFMRQGLRMVIDHCFGKERLHRLEANIQPENARSIALAQGLGFSCEGFSRRYLKIGGRWKDHERWALLVEDWKRQTPRKRRAPRAAAT
jgi:ribosomal-protein-alanine N-acetyltransferase